jgi:hypothetical protein
MLALYGLTLHRAIADRARISLPASRIAQA